MKLHRFVVLLHEHPNGNHWDFMLETGMLLTTWAIPPQRVPLQSFQCQAKKLPDHRLLYLDYEGEISQQRGSVQRIDSGTYHAKKPELFWLYGKLFNGILNSKQLNNNVALFFYQSFS
ncbi:MAG: hypothetical protein LBI18_07465 [Planctomycetaceae bacterium]|jgi:hypothetical protein|nr:hypothetical protein [Planctomycetaceae bacterium]